MDNKCTNCAKELQCVTRKGSHKNCFKARRITNADRIRAMSDEKLAVFMREMMDCVSCRQVMSRHDITCTGNYAECVDMCKLWLSQPAGEGAAALSEGSGEDDPRVTDN